MIYSWAYVSNSFLYSPLLVSSYSFFCLAFGFSPPSITPTLALMQGPIPNVITLPYGKCPPLHIQASSWKQLLKLLTRLSDSRIEPTVQALAGTKSELKLRTVIQFIKVLSFPVDYCRHSSLMNFYCCRLTILQTNGEQFYT